MKKTKEVDVCDFCLKEEEYLRICCVCGKLYCSNCSQNEDWRFVDTLLCDKCNNLVWKEFPKLLKKLKEKHSTASPEGVNKEVKR